MKVGAQVSDMYLGNFTKYYLILMLAVSHLVNQDVLSSMHA